MHLQIDGRQSRYHPVSPRIPSTSVHLSSIRSANYPLRHRQSFGNRQGSDQQHLVYAKQAVLRGIRHARQRVRSVIAESESKSGCSSRISIVGAGPIGLFAAICLCLKHGRLLQTSCGKVKFRRHRPFPSIRVYERRSGREWGQRDQLIILQNSVQSMLSGLLMTNELHSNALQINRIEKTFRSLLERVFGIHVVQREIRGNRDLLDDGTDVVIWAGGRSSPSAAIRTRLNMNDIAGRCDHVLIFTFDQSFMRKLLQIIHLVPIHPPVRMLIRPGPGPDLPAKLWLVGVHPDFIHEGSSNAQHDSLISAWTRSGSDATVVELLRAIESRTGSIPCCLQHVLTGYRRSMQPVAYVGDDGGRHIPVLLIGDAAFSKPFYTVMLGALTLLTMLKMGNAQGTTLNNHLVDVHALVVNTDWNTDNINQHNHQAFRFYERMFRNRVQGPRFTPQ